MKTYILFVHVLDLCVFAGNANPTVVNTWAFTRATEKAWERLSQGATAMDAVVEGCSVCEESALDCGLSVGYGKHPDEAGETTLDAMIMDGLTHDAGSVGALREIKNAIRVAQAVMNYTTHTMLVGSQATEFAVEMGFSSTDLSTNASLQSWESWVEENCQPNYRQNVLPDPKQYCGPYTPIPLSKLKKSNQNGPQWIKKTRSIRYNADISEDNHDTIAMIALDANNNMAAGTSTNGASHKVPGRVGDSPIVGAGAYVDNDIGGAGATGDGDVMVRFLPSFEAVKQMEAGYSPTEACQRALDKIYRYYPDFSGALVALDKKGVHGGACRGFNSYRYSLQTVGQVDVQIISVPCI